MDGKCPRCRREYKTIARFCARCGLTLDGADAARLTPGMLAHPSPLPCPPAFAACADARDLYCSWESVSGGPCMGAEPIAVNLFNAGYSLNDARLRLVGRDEQDRIIFDMEQSVRRLPHGAYARVEVPSWEVAHAVRAVDVALAAAEFAWPE